MPANERVAVRSDKKVNDGRIREQVREPDDRQMASCAESHCTGGGFVSQCICGFTRYTVLQYAALLTQARYPPPF
jgi:hypothetical protein